MTTAAGVIQKMLDDVSYLTAEKSGRGLRVNPHRAVPHPRSTFSVAVGFGDGRQRSRLAATDFRLLGNHSQHLFETRVCTESSQTTALSP